MESQRSSACCFSESFCDEICIDKHSIFEKIIFYKGESYKEIFDSFYQLVFILEGEVGFSYNGFREQLIQKGEVLFLPSKIKYHLHAATDSSLLVLRFDDKVNNLCDKGVLYYCRNSCQPVCRCDTFPVLRVTPQLHLLIEQIEKYIELHLLCPYVSDLKEKELFALLPYNYSKEELCKFFHPILLSDIHFRGKVIQCMLKNLGIGEIARQLNMSVKTFGRHFIDEFGESPRVWLKKEKAKQIKIRLLNPDVTLMDIILEYNFTDMSHFAKFCREHYGCKPTEFLKQVREIYKS